MTAIMIDAALRGLALAAIVGAGLYLLRVTNVPVRKAAWILVLIASLAMPFLTRWSVVTRFTARFGWTLPVHRRQVIPAWPELPTSVQTVVPPAITEAAAPFDKTKDADALSNALPIIDLTPRNAIASGPAMTPGPTAVSGRTLQWPPLENFIAIIYVAVGGALLLRLLLGLATALWIWTRAEEVSPLVAPEPNVRVSEKIPSPVTIGSGIVLPANYTDWSRAKLRVVLAHERSHVRQMDFYLQLLAGLYTAFFWFSPLGWWLKSSLSALGEAISDRAGIEVASCRSDYAGVLLEFAAAARRALPGVAMARGENLSRRVEGLLNENLFRKAFAEGRRRALVSLLLLPAALFAVTALVRVPHVAAQMKAAAQTPSKATALPAGTWPVPDQTAAQQPLKGQSNPSESRPVGNGPDTLQDPAAPPVPQPPPATGDTVIPPDGAQTPQPAPAPQAVPVPPGKPGAPPAARAPQVPEDASGLMTLDVGPTPGLWVHVPKMPAIPLNTRMLSMMGDWGNNLSLMEPNGHYYLTPNGSIHGYAYYFSSNGDSWAIVDGPGKNFSMGEGATKDQLDLAQRMARGPFLWFTRNGKSYMVDDPAIVAQIQSLCVPMKGFGTQQQSLGIQQRVLAKMQADLARSQRENSTVQLPDLSKEMADAESALASLKSGQGQMMSEEKVAEVETKLAEVERKLAQLQMKAAMQNNFGERMRSLGEQQRQLGEQQRQLGEQQKKLAEQAEQQVQSIIQQCLQNGKATQLK